MRVDKVVETLVKLYEIIDPEMGRTSTMFLGPPGIGKSMTVKQAAKNIAEKKGFEFVEYHDDIADDILAEPEKYFVYVDIRLKTH
jgi:DNA replication protein DnaC